MFFFGFWVGALGICGLGVYLFRPRENDQSPLCSPCGRSAL